MSNGRRCLVMCTSKGNFDGNSQRSRLQIPICSCDWTGWWKCVCHNVDVWTRKILNCTSDELCTEKLQWNTVPIHTKKMLLSSVIMIVKGFCVRTCTRSEIWLGMTTSRKILVDTRSVTLKSVLDAYSQLPLTSMNSLRTLSRHSRHQHLSFKLLTFLEIEASMNDACRFRDFSRITLYRKWRRITWSCSDDTCQRRWSRASFDDQKFMNSNTPWTIILQ